MDRAELEKWTKEFALRVVRFVAGLPKNKVADVLGYQVLKSATSNLESRISNLECRMWNVESRRLVW
jgi:hypothetical protein